MRKKRWSYSQYFWSAFTMTFAGLALAIFSKAIGAASSDGSPEVIRRAVRRHSNYPPSFLILKSNSN
jgi:hypothetical protein